MDITVVGAGAMGCVFGTRLAKAGATVAFLDINREHVDAINRDGLRLAGVFGDETFHIPATTAINAEACADLVLILVDSTATADAARSAFALLKPGGFVLTLQNGIGNVEKIAAVCGADRILAGSTYNSAALLGPGHVLHSNLGETVLGEALGGISGRARDIASLLTRAGLPSAPAANAIGVLWSKFILNCAINPVSALTGMRPGEIARNDSALALLEGVLAEILQVVKAKGVDLPDKDMRKLVLDHCWVRYNKPSMLQHVERGSKTEIEALNGALVSEARSLGVFVPINEMITCAIHAIEEKNRRLRYEPPIDEAALEAAAAGQPRTMSGGPA